MRRLAALRSVPRLPRQRLPVGLAAHCCRYATRAASSRDIVAVEAARERVAARKPAPDIRDDSRTL